MCCVLRTELGYYIEIEYNTTWIYDSNGEFLLDIPIKFCPFCGENLQKDEEK